MNKILAKMNRFSQKQKKRLLRFYSYIQSLFSNGNIKYRKTEKFLLILSAAIAVSIIVAIHLDGKMTSAASSSYTTSWIGNSFGGGDKWVQIQISGMYVAPDGTIYTNSEWDEAGREVGIYRNGDVIGKAEDLHGWGRNGGVAIAADNKYIYVAMKQIGDRAKERWISAERNGLVLCTTLRFNWETCTFCEWERVG